MIVRPRFVALDSAHLIQWFNARTSPESEHKAAAQEFERWLEASSFVPLFTHHHITELANHENEALVAKRLHFLAGLPFVAWIAGADGGGPGTIVSLLAAELKAAVSQKPVVPRAVCALARDEVIRTGSGEKMLGMPVDGWLALRPIFASQASKARAIAAFARIDTVNIAATPIRQLMNGKIRRGEKLDRQMEVMAGTFAADIRRRGDPRIVDPVPMVAEFMHDVGQMAQSLPGTTAEFVLQGLESQHVFLEDIGPSSTVGEMLDLGLFRSQMKIAARAARVEFTEVVRGLRPEHIPTWLLERTLIQHLPDSRKREGGELMDTHLACLALYTDLTLVDKRTLEGFRRLRQKEPALARLIGKVDRAVRFDQIPRLAPLGAQLE